MPPDYFLRRTDGSAVVIDCRPAERRNLRDTAAWTLEPGLLAQLAPNGRHVALARLDRPLGSDLSPSAGDRPRRTSRRRASRSRTIAPTHRTPPDYGRRAR